MLSREYRRRLNKLDPDYANYLNKLTDDIFLHVAEAEETRSWSEICHDANICYGTFHKIRNGETMFPRLHTIWKLANAVGYDINLIPKSIKMKRPVKGKVARKAS